MGRYQDFLLAAQKERGPGLDAQGTAGCIAARTLADVASLAPQLADVQLRTAATQAAMEGLMLCEQQAQRCIGMLVTSLGTPQAGLKLCHDALWILNMVVRRHGGHAGQWVLNAGGVSAAWGLLTTYHSHADLVQGAIWLVYMRVASMA